VIHSIVIALSALQPAQEHVVQPYYVFPADFSARSEHRATIQRSMEELQGWFRNRVGSTFTLKPLIEVRSRQDYVTMRVGPNAAPEDANNKTFMPSWFGSLREAVGGEFKPKQVSVIFAAGGGGYTTGRLSGQDSGVAVVGDWFLEAESKVKDPQAIPAPADSWEVKGGAPVGILAARMGQAFGLLQPTGYPGPSLVGGFQSYPNTRLMAHEQLILRNSPFFAFGPGDNNVPRIAYETADKGFHGDTFYVLGEDISETDLIEVSWMGKATDNPNATIKPVSVFVKIDGVSEDRARFKVPQDAGPGFIRLWRGSLRSNIVPVNFYPASAATEKSGSLTPITRPNN